jgi:FtsH-binding integral membrane protein
MRPVRTNYRQAVDVGLRAYLLRIYQYMGLGLALTGVMAYVLAHVEGMNSVNGLSFFAALATFGIVIYFNAAFQKMSASTAQMLFWVYSALNGIALTYVFGVYHSGTIARAFLITAATFGVMTVYGHATNRDLTGFGSFFRMGLWGIVIAGFVNIFFKSSMIHFVISVVGVGVFTGLIAYQTQALRQMYYALPNDEDLRQKMSIMGALSLYLSVLNLFLSILRLMNDRK